MKHSEFNQIIATSITKTQLLQAIAAMDLEFEVQDGFTWEAIKINEYFADVFRKFNGEESEEIDSQPDSEVDQKSLESLKTRYTEQAIIHFFEGEMDKTLANYTFGFPASDPSGRIVFRKGVKTSYMFDQDEDGNIKYRGEEPKEIKLKKEAIVFDLPNAYQEAGLDVVG